MLKQNMTLSVLLLNLFIAFLGIGLVIPVTPTIMNELNLSGSIVGYMVSAFAVAQLIVSPIAGIWVDKFGRKKSLSSDYLSLVFQNYYSVSEII